MCVYIYIYIGTACCGDVGGSSPLRQVLAEDGRSCFSEARCACVWRRRDLSLENNNIQHIINMLHVINTFIAIIMIIMIIIIIIIIIIITIMGGGDTETVCREGCVHHLTSLKPRGGATERRTSARGTGGPQRGP